MLFVILYVYLIPLVFFNQVPQGPVRTIAFYNVENLFDTIDQEGVYDEDYTRKGRYHYSSKDFKNKITKLSQVIANIGSKESKRGPDLIGVSEIENHQVLVDLIRSPDLDSLSFGIVHENSPDRRGIDVALLYREGTFFPIEYENMEVRLWDQEGNRIYTRDVLWVHGIMDGEELHLFINHWPSRRGGSKRSESKRNKAAWINRKKVLQILQSHPNSKILIMGDFNDDPIDQSIRIGLSSKNKGPLNPEDFFNPMEKMFKKGWNTLVYRDQVHLFDQILLSRSLVHPDNSKGFKLHRAGIYNPEKIVNHKGRYKGYPLRSFENGKFNGGYSDHFPVYVQLIKQN